ncbi:MAG: helix-turn-helix transcriptional regulator [Bacillota bacterium]|nr:helix-turn-helix transcriptional regulator [Bacillota bacterium]
MRKFSENITDMDVAKEVFFSPGYASSLYKSETGYSIVEYIIHVRIEKAKERLSNPNTKIADVAQDVGYNNIAYFSSLFKNSTGISPREYWSGFPVNLMRKDQKVTDRMDINMRRIISRHTFGDMSVTYITDESGRVGIVLSPVKLINKVDFDKDCAIDSLIQLKLAGDVNLGSFGCGITMRNNATLDRFSFEEQTVSETDESITVKVTLKANALSADHWLVWYKNCEALKSRTAITNNGHDPVKMDAASAMARK